MSAVSFETLNTEQLGKIIGMSPNAIRIHLHRDPSRLPSGFRIGSRWRWNKATVLQWLKERS